MAAADRALDRERNRLLARVARILDSLDVDTPGTSLRALAPQLVAALLAGRTAALDVVTGRASAQLTKAVGVDLGWDLIDRSGWTGPNARKVYAARLLGAAAAIDKKLAAGADPLEEAGWVRYWQMQIAGSEVHRVARDANLQVARDVPALSRVMRVAEPGACDWCRTHASRGPVFHSEATALAVGHAHCRCHIVVVEDAAAIKVIRDAGAEAWQQSGLSARANPFTATSNPNAIPASAYLPGARTPERLTSIRARLASYETEFAAGRGSDWMREQVSRLRTELTGLQRALAEPRLGAADVGTTGGKPVGRAAARAILADARTVVMGVHDVSALPRLRIEPMRATTRGLGPEYNLGEYELGGTVRIGRLSAQNLLTAVHEIGHAVDEYLFGRPATFASAAADPAMASLFRAIDASEHAAHVQTVTNLWTLYARKPEEMFARAYAQWVTTRTQDGALLRALAERQGALRSWLDDDFVGVAREFDRLFQGEPLD